jgi:hypothetical protein
VSECHGRKQNETKCISVSTTKFQSLIERKKQFSGLSIRQACTTEAAWVLKDGNVCMAQVEKVSSTFSEQQTVWTQIGKRIDSDLCILHQN